MSKLLFLTKAKTNRRIKLGETIKFLKEPELSESFNVKVTGLLRYESFKDMFKDFDISILADKSITKEEQEQYGVLGIRIELID